MKEKLCAEKRAKQRERVSLIPPWLYAEREQQANPGIGLPDCTGSNARNVTTPCNAGPTESIWPGIETPPPTPLGVTDDARHERGSDLAALACS